MTAISAVGQTNPLTANLSYSSSLVGAAAYDVAGWDVAFVGDVNKDGFGDLLIGAPENNKGGLRAGAAYLIFGAATMPSLSTSLTKADVTFIGTNSKDEAGMKVAGVGDVNGDGFSDFVIAAPMEDNGTGKIYLAFGKASGWQAEIKLSEADVIFSGENWGDNAGITVVSAGDVNNDGVSDLIIGAPRCNSKGKDAGKTYLIFGKKEGWSKNISLVNADVIFEGETPFDMFGTSVAGIGDVNKDGIDDIAIGAPFHDSDRKKDVGKVYIFFGKGSFSTKIEAAISDASLIGKNVDDLLGKFISNGGDVNGDGIDDFSVTASLANSTGEIYLIRGKTTSWSQNDIAEDFAPSFIGENPGDCAGVPTIITNLNKDGFSDVLIGASKFSQSGKVYFIEGKSNGWSQNISLANADIFMPGEKERDHAGHALAAGDFDGDGYPDVAVGAPGSDVAGDDAGIVYLFHSPFKSMPVSLTLTAPNGGENWVVGSEQKIKWTSEGKVEKVSLKYSIDNGINWKLIVENTSNDGEHAWTVPDGASTTCLVSVEDAIDGDPLDTSEQVFAISELVVEKIKLIAPNGGECWLVATEQEIKWTSQGAIKDVNIEYSIDGGQNWVNIIEATPDDGSHHWIVPQAHSKNCLVKIADVDGVPEDTSDAVFTIWDKASITVLTPNGGECLHADQEFEIKWEAGCYLDSLKIQYSIDGGEQWTTIVYGTENDGKYPWKVPKLHSDSCLIKVADLDCDPEDVSDSLFTIWGKPLLTVISPNEGECLNPEQQFEIKWEASCCFDSVKIQYSIDGGENWTTIVKSTPNDSCYLWTVPAIHSANCLVKVADRDCDPEDISDKSFTIWNKTPITVLSPNGGERLHAAQKFEINWEASCSLDSLKIQYSIDGGKEWKTIVDGTENDGNYLWTVPKVHSDSCLIKVADRDCVPEDVSDSLFTIWGKAPITVISPNGDECLKPGQKIEINWEAYNCLDSIKIQYSINGGESWTTIVKSTPNDSSYLWTVPAFHSTNCLVKVADLDCDPEDISDKSFTIWNKAPITVLSPNSGECLHANQKFEIKWEASCSLDSMKIQYSVDGGKIWTTIVYGTENDGCYLWTVPKIHSDSCLIKLADLDCNPEDVSDSLFTIWGKAPVTVLYPNGGECLKPGKEIKIKWEACCCLDSLKIQYSTDGGDDWTSIVYGTENDGSFLWTVPDVHSNNCLIKVADLDCDPSDVSDKPFTVWGKAPITVVLPNGRECLKPGQKIEIKWEAICCLDSLKIQFSSDAGKDWRTIVYGTPNDSSYWWTVPNVHSTQCLIKVADLDCDPEDVSNKTFAIWNKAPITVISPNGGECLLAGQNFEIKWAASCCFDSLKIQYSIDGGDDWNTIIYGTPNDSSYLHCLY